MKPTTKFMLLFSWAIVALVGKSGALTLTNAGFESNDFTGWSTFGQGWRISSGADAHTGTNGVVDDVTTTDTDSFRGIFQAVAATPGQEYAGGVWIRAVNVESSESWFELQFWDSASNVLFQAQSAHVTANQPFTFMDIASATAPAGTAFASVRGIVQMVSQPTVNTDFHIFDDFAFAAIPEPSTALLLPAGLAVIAWLRRGKRS